jgi:hypothetical protein
MPLCRWALLYHCTNRPALSGGLEISKPPDREFRPIFGGTKQRLGEGVVVADPRAGIGICVGRNVTSQRRTSPG